jgi:uncharacterized membrane protein YphA (DoxX/SURF4 family)
MNSTFTKILRIVLGVGLVVFGLNKFFGFIPAPSFPEDAAQFIASLRATGYVLYVVGVLETFVGVLLLFNKWVPFALILLAPIALNILLFHLFLDLPDIAVALIIATINSILIYKYWRLYRPLFQY